MASNLEVPLKIITSNDENKKDSSALSIPPASPVSPSYKQLNLMSTKVISKMNKLSPMKIKWRNAYAYTLNIVMENNLLALISNQKERYNIARMVGFKYYEENDISRCMKYLLFASKEKKQNLKFWKIIASLSYANWLRDSNPKHLEVSIDAMKLMFKDFDILAKPRMWYDLGKAYYCYGALEGAVNVFSNMITNFPTYKRISSVIWMAAMCLKQLGAYENAIPYVNHILGDVPKNITEDSAMFVLFLMYEAVGNKDLAREAQASILQRARNGGPTSPKKTISLESYFRNPQVWYDMAFIFLESQDFFVAAEILQRGSALAEAQKISIPLSITLAYARVLFIMQKTEDSMLILNKLTKEGDSAEMKDLLNVIQSSKMIINNDVLTNIDKDLNSWREAKGLQVDNRVNELLKQQEDEKEKAKKEAEKKVLEEKERKKKLFLDQKLAKEKLVAEKKALEEKEKRESEEREKLEAERLEMEKKISKELEIKKLAEEKYNEDSNTEKSVSDELLKAQEAEYDLKPKTPSFVINETKKSVKNKMKWKTSVKGLAMGEMIILNNLELLKQNLSNFAAAQTVGMQYFKMDDVHSAVKYLNLASHNTDQASLHWETLAFASVILWKDHFADFYLNLAIKCMNHAMKIFVNLGSPSMWFDLARYSYIAGDYVEALNIFSKMIGDFPSYRRISNVVWVTSLCFFQLGHYNEAITYLDNVLINKPNKYDEEHIWFVLALVYKKVNNEEMMNHNFEEIFTKHRTSLMVQDDKKVLLLTDHKMYFNLPSTYLDFAMFYFENEDYTIALESFQEALRLASNENKIDAQHLFVYARTLLVFRKDIECREILNLIINEKASEDFDVNLCKKLLQELERDDYDAINVDDDIRLMRIKIEKIVEKMRIEKELAEKNDLIKIAKEEEEKKVKFNLNNVDGKRPSSREGEAKRAIVNEKDSTRPPSREKEDTEKNLVKQKEQEEEEALKVKAENDLLLKNEIQARNKLKEEEEEKEAKRIIKEQEIERIRLQKEMEEKENERLKILKLENEKKELLIKQKEEEEEKEKIKRQQDDMEREKKRIEKEELDREALRIQKEEEQREKERIRIQRQLEEEEREKLKLQREQEAQEEILKLQIVEEENQRIKIQREKDEAKEKESEKIIEESKSDVVEVEKSNAPKEVENKIIEKQAGEKIYLAENVIDHQMKNNDADILLKEQEEADKRIKIEKQRQEEEEQSSVMKRREEEEAVIRKEEEFRLQKEKEEEEIRVKNEREEKAEIKNQLKMEEEEKIKMQNIKAAELEIIKIENEKVEIKTIAFVKENSLEKSKIREEKEEEIKSGNDIKLIPQSEIEGKVEIVEKEKRGNEEFLKKGKVLEPQEKEKEEIKNMLKMENEKKEQEQIRIQRERDLEKEKQLRIEKENQLKKEEEHQLKKEEEEKLRIEEEKILLLKEEEEKVKILKEKEEIERIEKEISQKGKEEEENKLKYDQIAREEQDRNKIQKDKEEKEAHTNEERNIKDINGKEKTEKLFESESNNNDSSLTQTPSVISGLKVDTIVTNNDALSLLEQVSTSLDKEDEKNIIKETELENNKEEKDFNIEKDKKKRLKSPIKKIKSPKKNENKSPTKKKRKKVVKSKVTSQGENDMEERIETEIKNIEDGEEEEEENVSENSEKDKTHAATKIQSLARGKKARKRVKIIKESKKKESKDNVMEKKERLEEKEPSTPETKMEEGSPRTPSPSKFASFQRLAVTMPVITPGFSASKSMYISYWRDVCKVTGKYYSNKAAMLNEIEFICLSNNLFSKEEAFLALADHRGKCNEAMKDLSRSEYRKELQVVVKIFTKEEMANFINFENYNHHENFFATTKSKKFKGLGLLIHDAKHNTVDYLERMGGTIERGGNKNSLFDIPVEKVLSANETKTMVTRLLKKHICKDPSSCLDCLSNK